MTGAYGVTQYDADGCLNASYDFLEYLKGVLDAIGDRIGTEELARAAADAALSLRIDGFTTTSFDEILLELANLSGRITQETDIRIEGDEIIATRIDAVEVTAGNAAASVIQEATARASEIAAMASLVTAVTARVGSAEAAITTEQTARTTADTALATQITTVNARVGATEASITSEQTARANAIAALASTLTVLTTRVGTAESTITTESIARTAENYSLATRIDTLEATVTGGSEGVIEALVQAEATARADADGALANTINALTARMFSAEGAITTEQTVRANADGAFTNQLNTLSSNLTGVDTSVRALITSESNARASADNALASRTTVIEARAMSHPSSSNLNPDFSVWSSPNSPPDGWVWWDPSYGIIRNPGVNGRVFSASFNITGTGNAGISQDIPELSFGAYVIEFSGRASTWQGAGVLVQFFDANGGYKGEFSVNAATEADTSGHVSADGGGGAYTRTWSKFYKTPVNGDWRRAAISAMGSWGGFGTPAAKTVSFDKVSVRPATASEIAAERADINATQALANISSEASTRASADSALATQVTNVSASITGSGNLLRNTDFANKSSTGWEHGATGGGGTYNNIGVNTPTDDWHPINENVLSFQQTNRVGSGHYGVWGQNFIAVQSNKYYQFYAFIAAHRAQVQVAVNFYDINDNLISNHPSDIVTPSTGGTNPNLWTQVGLPLIQAPANATKAYFEVRKWDTDPGHIDSWIWVWKPYFGPARAGQNEYNDFSHGSSRLNIAAAFAEITLVNNARVTATDALASQIGTINTTLNGQSASISSVSSSINGVLLKHSILLNSNGHITGFIQNNNGSSGSFTVVADNFSIIAPNGGSPVTPFSVTAEGVRINGNLVVSGSINSAQLADGAATRHVSAYTPNAINLVNNTWVTVQSAAIISKGAPTLLIFTGGLSVISSGTFNIIRMRLLRNSSVVLYGPIENWFYADENRSVMLSVTDPSPLLGENTWQVQFELVTAAGGSASLSHRSLTGIETVK